MLFDTADAALLEHVLNHFIQPKRLIEFTVGEQASVDSDLAAEEFKLQTAVELDSKIFVLAVTH